MVILNVGEAEPLLMEVQAAKLLNLSPRTLQNWRSSYNGPLYIRVGRAIRYRRRDLIAWIDANTIGTRPL
jgi:Helix-turn-helix domain